MEELYEKQRKIMMDYLNLWNEYVSVSDTIDEDSKESYIKKLKSLRDEYLLGVLAMQFTQLSEAIYNINFSKNIIVPDIDINNKIIS